MPNKAHTATLNRIRQKLGVPADEGGDFDVQTAELIIEVETSATVAEAVERLRPQTLPCYIAVTNKEGLALAKSLIKGTAIGLMDPQGNVILEPNRSE